MGQAFTPEIHKSQQEFSSTAIVQAHEEVNAVIKDDGGAIGFTEDPSVQTRLMVAGPELSHPVAEYEQASGSKEKDASTKHHEAMRQTQRLFLENGHKL